MKKLLVTGTLLCSLFILGGCDVSSPVGTVSVNYDGSKTSENVTYVDDSGNRKEIDVKSVSNVVDKLLGDVALPNGASKDDLEGFINESLNAVGLDLKDLDTASDEDKAKFKETLEKKLQESGIDSSELDIDSIINKSGDAKSTESPVKKKVTKKSNEK